MADIEIKNAKGKHLFKSSRKKSTKVDLTPMVDLGFLLITFFVFTSAISKPRVMDIITPNDTVGPATELCNSCALTVLLDKNDKLYYYEGAFGTSEVKKTDLPGVREVIHNRKNNLLLIGRQADELALIIKSADSASLKNFVDITDEVTINEVKHYFIDELLPAEKNAMLTLRNKSEVH